MERNKPKTQKPVLIPESIELIPIQKPTKGNDSGDKGNKPKSNLKKAGAFKKPKRLY